MAIHHVSLGMRSTRRGARGAVFVESLVVISVFVLFLLGILFFRELYVKKLTAQRLARAAALAHSMAACKPDVRGILRNDLPSTSSMNRQASKESRPVDRADAPNSKGNNILDRATEGGSGTLLNEINDVSISSSASATSKPSPFEREIGFRGDVASSSYVSCGDELKEEQYDGIVSFATSQF